MDQDVEDQLRSYAQKYLQAKREYLDVIGNDQMPTQQYAKAVEDARLKENVAAKLVAETLAYEFGLQ
jgi:uncharacterized membrane protein